MNIPKCEPLWMKCTELAHLAQMLSLDVPSQRQGRVQANPDVSPC